MGKVRPLLAIGALTLFGAAAFAQSAPPTPSTTAEKPAAIKPEPTPSPAPVPAPKSAGTVPEAQLLVGKHAFSSDGTRVGDVHAVKTAPDGKVASLLLKTGGFLGFGGRIVVVPEGRFTASSQDVRLAMTADEASKLPEVKDAMEFRRQRLREKGHLGALLLAGN